jgi:uncharacterized protein (DUF1697 family)
MKKYVAFLRGINSGGNQTVWMEVLRKIFEDLPGRIPGTDFPAG